MKYETHSGGKESARKQERIRFYESKVKEDTAAHKQKSGADQIRK